MPVSDAAFTVTFEYDVDGILHVMAQYKKSGRVILDEELTFGAAGDKAQLVNMRKRIDGLNKGLPAAVGPAPGANLSPESRTALQRARMKIMPHVDADTQVELGKLASALETCSPDGEGEARRALEAAVREHSYLL
jgi:molecular chaperone DnaK